MQTRSRSSVLGKRDHQPDTADNDATCHPDHPKRARISLTRLQGDWNKENIAPFAPDSSPPIPSPPLARTSTPTRTRSCTSFQPIHARARVLLRATCNASSTQIAGREAEREAVRLFTESFLHDDHENHSKTTTLYISGSPGTGKTALVNSVLHHDTKLRILSINCMALNSLDELWDRIVEELVPGALSKNKGRGTKKVEVKGREAVLKALEEMDGRCILVLDELDHIAHTPMPLISIFSLPASSPSTLRIIGIANTHTLTSSVPLSTKGIKTLHFAPYDANQLLDILRARLQPLFEGSADENGEGKKFLPLPTLTLLTKKVASQTGDVRSLFEVLRGAIDLASSSSKQDTTTTSKQPTVTPAHILAALKAHAPSSTPTRSSTSTTSANTPSSSPGGPGPGAAGGNSETATKIRNLGLQAQLVLLSILLASKRLEAGLSLSGSHSPASPTKSKSPIKRTSCSSVSSAGIETTALHAYYTTLLTRASNEVFTPVSRSEFSDVVGMLEVVGLVSAPLSISASISSLSLSRSSAGSNGTSSSPVKGGKRTFGRSASFGGTGARGCGVSGVVKIAEGVRVDEVLRGLGVQDQQTKNVREEEICAIWEKERARIGREGRVGAKGKGRGGDVFVDAMED